MPISRMFRSERGIGLRFRLCWADLVGGIAGPCPDGRSDEVDRNHPAKHRRRERDPTFKIAHAGAHPHPHEDLASSCVDVQKITSTGRTEQPASK